MKRNNDFVVGLTILVGIVGVIAGVLWMRQADLAGDRLELAARFRDVGNVRIGAQVVIRGVPSGRLRSLELARDGWVHARFRLDATAALPEDPVMLLNESSLFGEWQATILAREGLPRDAEIRRLIDEASGARDLLPGATLPDIAKLTAVAGGIAGDVANVAERVQIAFTDSAARELRESFRNFSLLSQVLAGTVRSQSQKLDVMTTELRQGVAQLVEASEYVKGIAGRVDSSTSRGEVGQIVGDAAGAARELRAAGARLRVMSEQLDASQQRLASFLATSDSIVGKLNRREGSLGLLVNDASLYRNVDSLTRSLLALVAEIRANPRRFVNVRIF